MKINHRLNGSAALLAVAAGLNLSGCAVTPGQVDARGRAIEREMAELPRAGDLVKAAQEPPFMRMKGNFLGSGAIPLNSGNSLPERFSRVSFTSRAGAEGTFVDAMKMIRDATGIPVRLNPDIFVNIAPGASPAPGAGVPGGQAGNQGAGVVTIAPAGGPLPAGFTPGAGSRPLQAATAPGSQQNAIVPAYTMVPLNFVGDLRDYLSLICGTAGLSCDYEENGELHAYRLLTRSFSVDEMARALDVSDVTNGGGQTSFGSSGQGGTGGTSTASNISLASVSTKFEPWADFVASAKGLLSPWGNLVANRATGTLVVTDTKANVERVGAFVAGENVKLRTRVDIEIRTITFELNEGTSVGADFGVIYKALQGNYTVGSTSPAVVGGGANSTPSTLTYTNTAGGRFNGSKLSLSALDQYGKVIADKTDTIRARNRAPAVVLGVRDYVYLASTTAATGGGTSGGTGVPGLTPGQVSYGTFFTVIPNVSDNGTVTISFSNTESRLISEAKASTGQGATFQQITTPVLARGKNSTDLVIPKGATEISVSSASDSVSSQSNFGFTGASAVRNRARTVTITLVTPHVLPGV